MNTFIEENGIIKTKVGDILNYIKNNKVFLFLFLSFSIIILSLTFKIVNAGSDDNNYGNFGSNQNTSNSISSFNGSFSDTRLGVEFSWNVQVASNDSIEKYEIYQEEELLKDGKNAASAVLPIKEKKFITGNNKFDLVITFTSGEVLRKTVYVYIDEVFAFKTSYKVEENKIVYDVNYYYDDRRVVKPPQMSISNATQPFGITYVSSEEVRKEGNYVYTKDVYELAYAGIEPGKYNIAIRWIFSNYNLTFNSTSSIEVEGD